MEKRAKELFLKAKKNVFNSHFGLNESPIKGDGLDFREIKEYEFEDLRRINWKASAKSGELKSNVYNETKELNVVVVLMLSSGLKFGTSRLKQDMAAEIFGLLGFATLLSKNRLFPFIFSDKIEKFYDPMSQEGEIYDVMKDILNIDPLLKKIDYKKLCETINHIIKKRAIIFIISDFLDECDLVEISFQNDIYAICLRDRFEENLTLINSVDVLDTQNLSKFELNLDKSSIEKYKNILKIHDEKVKEHFLQNKISFGKIYTDDDAFSRLLEIVRR